MSGLQWKGALLLLKQPGADGPQERHTETGFQGTADRATIVPVWRVPCWRDWFYLSALLLFFYTPLVTPDITTSLSRAAGLEGRAGMAAITPREGRHFDTAAFYQHVVKFLPNYARPRFVRVQVSDATALPSARSRHLALTHTHTHLSRCLWLQDSLDVTGTFKYLKTALVKEGFDPSRVAHPLYFLDEQQKDYVPLTREVFDSVVSGKIKI